jgi:hypothetical protein
MGKPEAVVMCHVEHSDSLMFGGSVEPASMIQVESIGCDLATIIPSLTEVSACVVVCCVVVCSAVVCSVVVCSGV